MAPIKSSLAKSAKKLIGLFNTADLGLRGATQITRDTTPPPIDALILMIAGGGGGGGVGSGGDGGGGGAGEVKY